MFCRDSSLIKWLVKRRAKTLLCAGNGISQEPRALAEAGFQVIAMDLSPRAVHLAETWQFGSQELDRFCPKELRAPGGSSAFTIGNILDTSVCSGPFDAIIERRTLQLFPPEERGTALDRLALRLKPDGLFISHCHDGGWKPPHEPVHHVEKFFRDRGWAITHGDKSNDVGRICWLQTSTG
jgi:chemotaxis methyl-accepting protein methylase